MADEGFKRKLAAILSADVEGYSRLMDDDEEATVRTLKTYRTAINDLVQQYRGRIVDSPGDNILAEFSSVVDAVNCAVEIQRDLAERNTELAYNRQMQFRIGVNLGDVIEDDGNIYGDGVNIAYPAGLMIRWRTSWAWSMKTLVSMRSKTFRDRYRSTGCCPIRGQLRTELFRRKYL